MRKETKTGQGMSIFEETVSIIKTAERLVIGPRVKSRWASIESMIDAVVHVPWFLLIGIREHLATFGFGLFLVPVWWCILVAIMLVTGGNPAANLHASNGRVVAGLMAMGSVLFPLPSRSARLSARPQHVASLAAYIKSVAPDDASISLLQSGVAALDSVASMRITRINWLLGICWAGLVWAASQWVFTAEVSDALRQEAMSRVFGGFLIFLFFGIGVMSHEATVRIVKQTIDFAFLQASDVRGLSSGGLAAVGQGD
ncbi:hypothetical protein HDE78_003013 [Rhodanobacter sp. K2T2]|uniref:hypothetical protein n=1 Tax=Rhodanobacter sp. K2T2 TaxID=2723085 RepID=UPI0015CC3966|nr:hypothetical protein [Rhodanobacter sp. K2T2]NYE30045.1 hypothetical protein [Rhodanobacter sp. K2T2]